MLHRDDIQSSLDSKSSKTKHIEEQEDLSVDNETETR